LNVALLTAAGNGSRMHQDIPKQFIHINNKPIIIYTLEAFQSHPSIDAIIVVGLSGWIEILWAYAKQFNIDNIKELNL
jgi:2-C-methyl-D-erythritol 4-phosphate cytidylyltransferase